MTTGKLEPLAHGAFNRCFGCGQANRTGLRLKFLVDEQHTIVCRVRLPRRFEGPSGHAHGGVIATLLDEAMSKANRQFGILAMTRQLEVDYLKPVPLTTPLTLTGRHTEASGRVHRCEAEITDESGTVLARSKAVFLTVDPGMLNRKVPSARKSMVNEK
ncbi:MAG: PaaI family thioesterase [Acidobacteriaceae bacterium]